MPTAQEYVKDNQKNIEAALDSADKDYELAEELIANQEFKLLPAGFTKAYIREQKALEKSLGDSRTEYARLLSGKSTDLKLFGTLTEKLQLASGLVGQQNARFQAIIDGKLASLLTGLSALFTELDRMRFAARLQEVEENLQKAKELLEKAKKEVVEAKVQAAINGLINLAMMAISPATAARKVGVVLGSVALGELNDAVFGPSGPSNLDRLNSAVGAYVEVPEKLSKGVRHTATAVTIIYTIIDDLQEIDEAKKLVVAASKNLEKASKEYNTVYSFSKKHEAQVARNYENVRKQLNQINQADSRYKASTKVYKDLLNDLKSWKKSKASR